MSLHPNVPASAQKWSEDQVIHIACAYTNPIRSEVRRKHIQTFIKQTQDASNVQLHMIELAYGDRPFDIDYPGTIQLRTVDELWHKENLLNIAISRFPSDWQYGGIVDGDFAMTRYDWGLEAIHQLQHHSYVQLYSGYAHMSAEHRPIRLTSGFAYNYVNRRDLVLDWNKQRILDTVHGAAHGSGLADAVRWPKSPGATGGAWAFTRAAITATGGLLDTCILGSGDWHMAFGLVGVELTRADSEMELCAPGYIAAARAWAERAKVLKCNIGYVDNFATHHFHGSYISRGYGTRSKILQAEKFDPVTDLSKDWQGVYQLNGNKPDLRDKIRAYFRSRNEDDPNLRGYEKHMI